MLRNIDHLVIVVRELSEAIDDYRQAGFTVTPGGEHLGGATHNALIAFQDGTYLELIAFREPDRPQEHKWWACLARGEGLIDYALLSDHLEDDLQRIRQQGLAALGPIPGGRQRPDGRRIEWRTALLGRGAAPAGEIERPVLPFLIEDLTPRELRVPGGEATRHRVPVTRVAGLTMVTADLDGAGQCLSALLASAGHPSGPLSARGSAALRFTIGRQWLELIQPDDQTSEIGQHLHRYGEGPYELVLADDTTAEPGSGRRLEGNLHNARIRLVHGGDR